MPALPIDPVDLATALPDVLWALVIAFVLAVVTSRPPKPPSMEDALASMGASDQFISEVTEDDDGS